MIGQWLKLFVLSGWHLPSKEEWEILMESVGGGKTAGKFLKSTFGWMSKGNGTDAYGFSALPCCRVSRVGSATGYGIIGDIGYWWSSTEYDASNAYSLLMFHKEEYAGCGFNIKNDFLNVRCLQDSKMQTETKPSENKEAVVESRSENSFTDSRDGKKYRTVVIGNQTWMAENLNYEVKSFFGLFSVGSKCYDNNPTNCNKYGRLYYWSAAKNACPKDGIYRTIRNGRNLWILPDNLEEENSRQETVGTAIVAVQMLTVFLLCLVAMVLSLVSAMLVATVLGGVARSSVTSTLPVYLYMTRTPVYIAVIRITCSVFGACRTKAKPTASEAKNLAKLCVPKGLERQKNM